MGWSFGGAVVISAGAENPHCIGVATLASQTYGTGAVGTLGPKKSLLLLHGTEDTCLSQQCSKRLYAEAKEPKEIVLYKGDNHGFTLNYKKATEKLNDWIKDFTNKDNM